MVEMSLLTKGKKDFSASRPAAVWSFNLLANPLVYHSGILFEARYK